MKNECYHSYQNCTEDIDTNENKHNFISYKKEEKYFPYNNKPNNCYNEEEMQK